RVRRAVNETRSGPGPAERIEDSCLQLRSWLREGQLGSFVNSGAGERSGNTEKQDQYGAARSEHERGAGSDRSDECTCDDGAERLAEAGEAYPHCDDCGALLGWCVLDSEGLEEWD